MQKLESIGTVGSSIKGGGRASLSDESANALVDCLLQRQRQRQRKLQLDLKRSNNSNNNNITQGRTTSNDNTHHSEDKLSKSNHAIELERKRFVKALVHKFEREHAQEQINGRKQNGAVAAVAAATTASPAPTTARRSSSFPPPPKSTHPAASDGMGVQVTTSSTGKVRVELVEAIYGKNDKTAKNNKNNHFNPLVSGGSAFRRGASKVLVLPRATTIPELLDQAQKKLHMKKNGNKPVRVFVLWRGDDDNEEVNLETNLAAIEDGTVLYVTAAAAAAAAVPVEEESQSKGNDSVNSDDDETSEILVDPLEAVKQAYSKQRRYHQRSPPSDLALPFPHPTFSDHFDALAPLSRYSVQLPAAACRLQVLQAVQDHRVVVICGATGCGKSTQVPQFLWQGLQASQSKYIQIVVTEPRRVAATSLARRVSEEMGSTLPGRPGSLCGHQVRLDRAVSDTAQIIYCTVGILLRRLTFSPPPTSSFHSSNQDRDQEPPTTPHIPLSDITHIVVDEVHERDVNTDFLLTLLRDALRRHPHLRVILMSATASTQLFVDYFASFHPVVLEIPGRSYPVTSMWLDQCQHFAASRIRNYHDQDPQQQTKDIRPPSSINPSEKMPLSPRATDVIDYVFVRRLIEAILRKHEQPGAILVFLPGKAEIEALFRVLRPTKRNDSPIPLYTHSKKLNIYKLHSGISGRMQQVVFEPGPVGSVKIILATNIAETSITIPDVSHVIDTGRVKEPRYNAASRIKELVTVWTSQASAQQRAGRAGRTTAGFCYKLYSQKKFDSYLLPQAPPEMVRTPLDDLILQLCSLYEHRRDQLTSQALANFSKGADPFKFFAQVPEPPPLASLEQACQDLLDVDALRVVDHTLDATNRPLYRLTPLGFHLSRLPMDAKVGKTLIVGCILQCLDGALTIAAALSCNASCFFENPLNSQKKARAKLIEEGFGGKDWRGGTVHGDLIAVIACYREWANQSNYNFASNNALNRTTLEEIRELRKQYFDLLVDAGFVPFRPSTRIEQNDLPQNKFQDDALLTSCCLVAGLYPNVGTLIRPRKGGPKGGLLLTKEGNICFPQEQSFQCARLQNAAESGKDAYAVYHDKYQSLGTGTGPGRVFLREVNFVSRYALMLFSGELAIVKDAIVLDGWLKWRIGDKGRTGAILLMALRQELDNDLLKQICRANNEEDNDEGNEEDNGDDWAKQDEETNELMKVVRQILADE